LYLRFLFALQLAIKKSAKRIIDCLSVTIPFVLAADLAGDLKKLIV